MPVWQNPFSLSRTHRGAWKRLDSEERYCAIQNLCNSQLGCCVFLQVAIFTVALWFAIHVHTRGQISLPSSVADAAMDNPRITTFMVTLVATILSRLNTLQTLFGVRGLKISWAWIKSLACMRDGRKDIAPSDRQYWTWMKYTLMHGILCLLLTPSWTSFLTPTPVELHYDFMGSTEVDYFAAAAQLQAEWNGYLAPYPSMGGNGFMDVTLYTQAGNAAVTNELGVWTYIPFQDAWYNGSTVQAFRPNMQNGLKNYTTVQQGLSAEVQCQQQPFINATDIYPSVGLYESTSLGTSITAPNQVLQADYGIQRWLMITDCSSDSTAYTSDILALVDLNDSAMGDGVLMGSVCKYQDFEKATNQSFLVLMQGFAPSYSFITPMICQVSPRITSVDVGFDGITVNIINTTNSEALDPEGQQAAYIDQISDLIWLMMFDMQSLSGNSMAAGIKLENYLRGAIEFLGTVWQVNLRQLSNTTMMQYTGIVGVQSMGYEYKWSTFLLLIVPLAVVVILTCAAAVYTPAAKPKMPGYVSLIEAGRTQEKMDGPVDHAPCSSFADSEDFDPTNIIHLMMLASRTDLENEAGENELFQFHLE
ncbi:hypothetical protein DFH29DRAFT_1022832 [Suillus ampliporus]|nr:hypothetical protein DFH29DRAFT_1022832 [Suillus ampliporus]